MIQKFKLERLSKLINPKGSSASIQAELRAAAEEILAPLQAITADCNRTFSVLKQQTRALNNLCMQNGFLASENETIVQSIADCQTFMVGSIDSLVQSELSNINQIAQMYMIEYKPVKKTFAVMNTFKQAPVEPPIVLRNTSFYGGKKDDTIRVFPEESFYEGKFKKDLSRFYLNRIEWGSGKNIESIKFTMSNGDESPKYGKAPFTESCDFDSRITMVKSKIRENRLVMMTIYTEADGEYLTIHGTDIAKPGSSVTTKIIDAESLVGFQMRMSNDVLQGLSYTIST